MDWEKAHAEADQALNDSSYKMGGLSPLLNEIANPKKSRIILYDGFLLAEGKAFNLRNISVIKIEGAFTDIPYEIRSKHVHKNKHVHIGYDIIFEFEKNYTYTYKSYRLSDAVMAEVTRYIEGCSNNYPVDVENITLHPLRQLKAIVNYDMEILLNTIQR